MLGLVSPWQTASQHWLSSSAVINPSETIQHQVHVAAASCGVGGCVSPLQTAPQYWLTFSAVFSRTNEGQNWIHIVAVV